MKRAFLGMDPYLEDRWPEGHARLIVYSSNQINAQLPADLQANIEQNLTVCDEAQPAGSVRPDLRIQEDIGFTSTASAVAEATIAEPLRVKRPPHADRHLEIVDRHGPVVTAIGISQPLKQGWQQSPRAIYPQTVGLQCRRCKPGGDRPGAPRRVRSGGPAVGDTRTASHALHGVRVS